MKQEQRYKTDLYAYLEPLLSAGANEDEIAKVREHYKKKQKAKLQREYRQANKQFTIAFSKAELRSITRAAAFHNRKAGKYIKEAVLAYSTQSYLIIDPMAVNQINQLLIENYCALQKLVEENENGIADKEILLPMITDLMEKIMSALEHPISSQILLAESSKNETYIAHDH